MDNPELQKQLATLDAELEEGDITHKGYQKRRTLLLAQFGVDSSPNSFGLISSGTSTGSFFPPTVLQSLGEVSSSNYPEYTSSQSTASNAIIPATVGSVQPERGAATGAPGGARGSFIHTAAPPHMRNNSNTLHVRNYSTTSSNPSPNSNVSFSFAPPPHDDTTPNLSPIATATMGSRLSAPPEMGRSFSFAPPQEDGMVREFQRAESPTPGSRSNTMYDSGNYFPDFTGQAYDPGRDSLQLQRPDSNYSQHQMMHRYSAGDCVPFSPTVAIPPPMLNTTDLPQAGVANALMPLEPRDVPFEVDDPHNNNIPMSKFDNIATILRHRAKLIPKGQAYIVLDNKGKEIAACSWEKLGLRAEKVAQVIRDKSNLYRGDRVALVYRDVELIDFAVALLGCFIAGVVAVPINNLEDYTRLNHILTSTQAHLALTTDSNLKAFQRDLASQKLSWPRGVEWWKTNEFGSFHPKKKEDIPPLQVPDLAYIEFSRAPTGDLRGVVLSHKTIMHQMTTLSAIIRTIPVNNQDTFNGDMRDKMGRLMIDRKGGEILVSYLDPRQGIGLIHSVLMTVYGGQTTVWCAQNTATTPGLYANIITRYKASLCLADYPALKMIAYNYQMDPLVTRNYQKKNPVDFSSIKLMMIDTITVDAEFHEILADRWLRPLGNVRAREVVAPMLCLPEHGGMPIAMRDWIGREERMGFPLSQPKEEEKEEEERTESPQDPKQIMVFSSLLSGPGVIETKKDKTQELFEVLLDREALKTNDVIVLAVGEEAQKRADDPMAIRVGAFGYPIPDATLAVVDPETSLLCPATVIGEIWVDSPSLSGGFWALPKQTESIFHARPYHFEQGDPNPVSVEPEFLRTGLLGCVIEGKIFVLGLYEDRLRQRVEWVDDEGGEQREEYRYFFVQHLVLTVMRKMSKVYDCSAFDVYVNEEHLPIILLESQAASTAPTTAGGAARQLDIALLDSLSERCMEVLLVEHQLRVYCVMITAPNTLPRVVKNGRREIGNMLCRKEFDAGTLPCVRVEFGVERAVRNLPIGIDPVGGIWSGLAAQARQDHLSLQEKQYSGVDYREVVIDDRTSTPLNNFATIVDLLQWRVARQAEEQSYCTIDNRARDGKKFISWKKLDLKIAAVAALMRNKWKLAPGDHAILIYTHSEDFLYALHACFCLGIIAIPLAPLDQQRLSEDIPALLHMVTDFDIKAIFVNNEVDNLLKTKPIAPHLKQSASILSVKIPPIHNSAKPPKSSQGCRDLGFTVSPQWIQQNSVALVWTYWTPDQRRVSVALGHDTIMGVCKVMKETCQMTSSRPVIGCVRSTCGMGFVVSWLMGIFVGAPTLLVSPVDFAQNPLCLFLALSRFKIKDTYATPQMMDHAVAAMPAKGFTLHELKNLMITCEGRPRTDLFQKVRLHLAGAGLDRTAINTIYSHVLNPMIASRSYMNIEPIELWLDPKALRRGLIYPVDHETNPDALLVQDSGMVPVQTQVAIVNPETNRLCHAGEYGEIWVESEACVKSFYGSKDPFDAERFQGRTVDGDPRITYVRTGDLGFLHSVSRPIGPGGALVDMQLLFVLGGIGETFEVNGLGHFPVDIEFSVEGCHRNIVPGGSAVFQAGGLVVILVEVRVKSYLASMVPVIVNAILDQHQLVVDIVAFVGKGDFPRSRLGEKQRGKILASWVTRKMDPVAQFRIREAHSDTPDGGSVAGGGGGNGGEPWTRRSSISASTGGGGQSQYISPPSWEATIHENPTMTRQSEHYAPPSPLDAADTNCILTTTPSEQKDLLVVELAAQQYQTQPELPAFSVGDFDLPSSNPITGHTTNTATIPLVHNSHNNNGFDLIISPPPKSDLRRSLAASNNVGGGGGGGGGGAGRDAAGEAGGNGWSSMLPSNELYPSEAILQMRMDEENQQQLHEQYGMAI